jgi:predicted amidohydrolase
VRAGGDNGKPYIVSLSGKSLADNLEMFGRACAKTGVAAVELNLPRAERAHEGVPGVDHARREHRLGDLLVRL